ncbi:hypothetical protein ET33_34840 [Paenibacillus tyrfis]|uniref:Uncharacterized protein n=1 Tax=Paenibacillus tyrfis TaxID=1501230 RepID=A0A081P6C2_9BACL|nr:hypothetical protein ET33_34840 [Paenibacillus tyrfis]
MGISLLFKIDEYNYYIRYSANLGFKFEQFWNMAAGYGILLKIFLSTALTVHIDTGWKVFHEEIKNRR